MAISFPDEALHEPVDYKLKYRNLKRKLKFLIYENECFQEELRNTQRKLLKVNRDKSFLLDRLLQFERIDDSSSESDATVSSDSELEVQKLDGHSQKSFRKKPVQGEASSSSSSNQQQLIHVPIANQIPNTATNKVIPDTAKRKKPTAQKVIKQQQQQPVAMKPKPQPHPASTAATSRSSADGHMTAEEIERHLESRRQAYMDLLPGRTPLTVPNEMFSNDPSMDGRLPGELFIKEEPDFYDILMQ